MKKLNPGYYLTSNIKELPVNQREQANLLYLFYKTTGKTGRFLVEYYLNMVMPIQISSLNDNYSTKTSHRCKRRKKLYFLLENYFYIKE